jgi:hypothetical protein
LAGLLYGLGQFILLVYVGFIFFMGVFIVSRYHVPLQNVLVSMLGLFYTGVVIGDCAYYMPDLAGVRVSAASLFNIEDGEDEDQ